MPNNFKIEFYLSIIDDFTWRFDKESMQLLHLASQFIKKIQLLLHWIHCSFSVNCFLNFIKIAPLHLFHELIEFQAEHYEYNDYIRFWRSIQKLTINLLATRILNLSSSTYVCEDVFSALNNIKSKLHSKLSDEHLLSALTCTVSNLEPDYEFLSTEQQCHRSHRLEYY